MRKIILFDNISLDGYFEGLSHDISGFKNDFEAMSGGPAGAVDALLFGKRTYEMMTFWSTPQGRERMPAVADFFEKTMKIVASHAPFDPGWSKVRVLSGDVPGQVRALKEQPGENILIFGSNTLCVSLLQAGLLDEIQLVINPVVLGNGTALFSGLAGKADFVLKDVRRFQSGAVMLSYTPQN